MAKKKRPRGSSADVAELRRRLQEAEDTINAIRDGHVEALVVSAPEGEQIYTLRSADQPYRLMVEQMREGALTLAADGTILYCNQRFAELMARPAERIAGQALREFLDADDRSTLQRVLQSESCRAEVQLKTAAGAVNPAQLSSITLNIDGVRTVAVVVTDLTHERTERGLRESNRLKDEFLATLSHELRTPLNVILGWTRMLLHDHLSDKARKHALELIERNAQAQAQLVNDLVDMSRMTTGKLQIELESLPVVPVLEAALESVRPAAEAKGLSIQTSWRVHDANVLADATRLQQIVVESHVQCGQVHAQRRAHLCHRGADGPAYSDRSRRYRHRDRSRVSSSRVRSVSSGGQCNDTSLRRSRIGAGDCLMIWCGCMAARSRSAALASIRARSSRSRFELPKFLPWRATNRDRRSARSASRATPSCSSRITPTPANCWSRRYGMPARR